MLQEWKGSIVRGAFGRVLKKEFCIYPKRKSCYKCRNAFVCPYGYLYRYQPESIDMPLSKCNQLPKPMVFEAPFDNKTYYERGKTLDFSILLFGRKASKYAGILIEVADKIEAVGRGKNQGYGRVSLIKKDKKEFEFEPPKASHWNKIKTVFETPVVLMSKKALITAPEFIDIVKAASRRYAAIFTFHGKEKINMDWKELYNTVESSSSTLEANYEPQIFGRYTTHEQKLMGVKGSGTYMCDVEEKNATEFITEMLEFCKYAHIGKFASFGLGKLDFEVVK